MGAKQSRTSTINQVQQDPELERLVMAYIQKFDSTRSSVGFMNRKRRQVDVESIQELLKSKEAMDGLRKIFVEYEASSREFSSAHAGSSEMNMSVASSTTNSRRRKYCPDSSFAA